MDGGEDGGEGGHGIFETSLSCFFRLFRRLSLLELRQRDRLHRCESTEEGVDKWGGRGGETDDEDEDEGVKVAMNVFRSSDTPRPLTSFSCLPLRRQPSKSAPHKISSSLVYHER